MELTEIYSPIKLVQDWSRLIYLFDKLSEPVQRLLCKTMENYVEGDMDKQLTYLAVIMGDYDSFLMPGVNSIAYNMLRDTTLMREWEFTVGSALHSYAYKVYSIAGRDNSVINKCSWLVRLMPYADIMDLIRTAEFIYYNYSDDMNNLIEISNIIINRNNCISFI